MDDLAYTLRQLCKRNRDGGHDTQAGRLRTLMLMSRQLRELGFRQMRASSLKGKHVEALLALWEAQGLSAGTVKNRMVYKGISGAALGNRPGVLRLQEGAFARRFDVIVVTDLTRLSRSQGDLSKMIDRLTMKGIRVVGVQDGYDSARRGHKLQAGLSGIIGEAFREMVKDRTYAALESRAKAGRPTGGRAYGYRDGKIDRGEAFVVLEIFGKFADGASPRSIAADLNARCIPSPGASWKRTQRRAQGWMGSGIRVIVRNERYRGVVHWNTSESCAHAPSGSAS